MIAEIDQACRETGFFLVDDLGSPSRAAAAAIRSARQIKEATGLDGRASRVHFVLDAGAVKDDYVLAYTWEGDRRVTWTLVQGQMQKRQDGSYTLVESDGRTEVTYTITIDLSIPMLGLIKRVKQASKSDLSMEWLKPFMTRRKTATGEVLFVVAGQVHHRGGHVGDGAGRCRRANLVVHNR